MSITRIEPGPRMSKGVIANGLLFTAGQVDTEGATVTVQTGTVLAKIDDLLAAAGSNRAGLVSATIWLSDVATFDEMNAVWEAWIDRANPPARATVEAKLANPKYLVEIAVVAVVPSA